MIDPHRRCGSTGHAASTSTFEGSNSSSSCGSRLGNREVEHGETDGVDEWHVAGDHGGPTRAGSAGGNPRDRVEEHVGRYWISGRSRNRNRVFAEIRALQGGVQVLL